MTKFSVIIPTYDHGLLLKWAITSVLQQTEPNWELLIIGDGCPPQTKQIISEYQKTDKRIKFFDKPKGPRNGEIYRHHIISGIAKGTYITYLSDDDLYFADHLQKLEATFKKGYNFITTQAVKVDSSGSFLYFPCDISSQYYQQLLLKGENRVPLSNAAHTAKLYRQLPHGWRTTPEGTPTDLYMWQQFLSSTHIQPATLFETSILNFASPARKDWSETKRNQELKKWCDDISQNPVNIRTKISSDLLHSIAKFEPEAIQNSVEKEMLNQIYNSKIGWLVKGYFGVKKLSR